MTDESNPFSRQTEQFPEPVAAPDETESTEARLRAFEDATLGEDHLRHKDAPEKGIGSAFSRMTDQQRAHHAALENLITVEKEHQAAHAAAEAATTKLEAAAARAAETEGALDIVPKES